MNQDMQLIGRLNQRINELFRNGHYEEAASIAIQVRDLTRQEVGTDHAYYASSLHNLARIYEAMGNYAEAEPLYRQARDIRRTALGENHPEYATSLNNLGMLYKQMGNYTEAEPLLRQASNIWLTSLGEQHPYYATSLNNLALLYKTMGDYTSAESLYRQASAIVRTALGEQHPYFAQSLNNLGMLYYEMGNYTAAEPLLRQASDVRRTTLGEQHPDYATSLNNLGLLYQARGNPAVAEPLLRQASDVRRTTLGANHPNYAQSLNNLGMLYYEMGKYTAAEPLLRQACEIRRTVLGANHPDYATNLNNLAGLYQSMGDFTTAEPLYQQANEIHRNILGAGHPAYATDLNNLATLYKTMGNYRAAEPLLRQASDILRTALGEQHQMYGQSLYNLANLYTTMGNYAAAELLYRQASDTIRAALGKDHPTYALSLTGLAGLYEEMGNYAKAEPLYRQASDTTRAALGKDHPNYAEILSGLAALYYGQNNYAATEPLLLEASDIRRVALGEDHHDYALSLDNLALLYTAMGNYAKAGPLYRQACDILRTALGEHHHDFAQSLNNLAMLYHATGDHAKAEALYRQACDILRAALGEQHPTYSASLNNLAILYTAINRADEALSLVQQAAAIEDKLRTQVFTIGSEQARMAYLQKLQMDFHMRLSLILQETPRAPTTAQTGLDMVLRRKAIGAEALAAQRDAILGGHYPSLVPKLQELNRLSAQIAQQTLAGPGADDPGAYRERLATWIAQHDQLEAELARQIPEMSLERQLRDADRHAVAQALPPDSVLIEFIRCEAYDFFAVLGRGESAWKPAHYLAFILRAGAPDTVTLIDLGTAAPIEQQIAAFRRAIRGEADDDDSRGDQSASLDTSEVSTRSARPTLRAALIRSMRPPSANAQPLDPTVLGISLRKALFDPLLPALLGRTRLFMAPDGDLTRLPFEALPLDDKQRIIDNYQISYLGSGRDILRFRAVSPHQPATPLIVADPNFDLGSPTVEQFIAGDPFQRLAGTRQEGEQVSALLQVPPLLDDGALEQALKGWSSPRILHIASHGFFLPDLKRDPNRDLNALVIPDLRAGSGLSRLSAVENPLLRSGLALAGANSWLQAHEQPLDAVPEDGILNAQDVSGLDLIATELVVLSACCVRAAARLCACRGQNPGHESVEGA